MGRVKTMLLVAALMVVGLFAANATKAEAGGYGYGYGYGYRAPVVHTYKYYTPSYRVYVPTYKVYQPHCDYRYGYGY